MGQSMVNFRMDTELKKDIEKVCDNIGLSMSSAFKIFAKKVVKEKMIPFLLSEDGYMVNPFLDDKPISKAGTTSQKSKRKKFDKTKRGR